MHKRLKERYATRITKCSSVALTAAIECLVSDLMKLSGEVAKANKMRIITPRHIMMASNIDCDFNGLLKNVIFTKFEIQKTVKLENLFFDEKIHLNCECSLK